MIKTKVLLIGSRGYLGSTLVLLYKKNPLLYVEEFQSENKIPDDFEMKKIISGYDVIVHVAGGGGSKYSTNEPYKALRDMVLFTDRLVKNAISQKIPKIIYTSTIHLYDIRADTTHFNEEEAIYPTDYYSSLKLASEIIVAQHPNHIILRLSHLYGYGSGQRLFKGGVLNNICKQAVNKEKVTISDLDYSLDLVCISDVVRAIEKAITISCGSQIINIGTGYSIKLKEILECISQFLEYDIEVINLNDNFLGGYSLSIDKAKKLLGWSPVANIQSEIKKLVNAYH